MSKFLIVGDIHLGKGLSLGKPGIGTQLNSRVADQIKLLNWVIDQAVEKNADYIILTGDITEESKPDYYLVNIFLEFLKKCELNNLDVFIINGNHDLRRTGGFFESYLDLLTKAEIPNVVIFKETETLHFDNTSITFLPYRDKRSFNTSSNVEALDALLEIIEHQALEIPLNNTSILIGHFALEGSLFTDESDDFSNELILPLEKLSIYDFVWMGHIHTPRVFSKIPHIAHTGSLDISNFGEADQTKVLILFDSELGTIDEIPVPSRPLKKISTIIPIGVDSTEYLINFLKSLPSLKNTIIKLEIKLDNKAASLDRKIIEKWLEEQEIHYLTSFSESRTLQPITSKVQILDESISVKEAIRIWSSNFSFPSNEIKTLYLDFANDVVETYKKG